MYGFSEVLKTSTGIDAGAPVHCSGNGHRLLQVFDLFGMPSSNMGFWCRIKAGLGKFQKVGIEAVKRAIFEAF